MIVTVTPKRPIPGILPKNKWIDREMELDLNKNEIKYCMQNAIVRDVNGTVIDELYVKKMSMHHIVIEEEELEPVTLSILADSEPVIIDNSETELPKVVTTGLLTIVEPETEEVSVEDDYKTEVLVFNPEEDESITEEVVEETPYYNLEVVSCIKEDEHIILELKMDTNSKLEGTLYGLFTIVSGPRPTAIEYKSGEDWIRFGNKFANFETIENDDRFVFRFIPKNENEFTYRASVKIGNDILTKLEDKVKPTKL